MERRANHRTARSLGQKLLDTLSRWNREQDARIALMRRSDRALADIGIRRADIPRVVKGLDPLPEEREHPMTTWWNQTVERWRQQRQHWARQRRIYRELMAYSDQELDDINVRRPDIARIAHSV